jgi:very-short-patch-repair endonuclease
MSTVEEFIVRIAERRLHLVTDDEVQRLGLTSRSVRYRLNSGRLHRVLPGVLSTYAGPYDVPQRELAICLSIPDAVLSHASAAAYWGIRRAPKDRVEVTVPHRTRVLDRRAVVHYSNRMPDHHVVDLVDGGRVTSVARTAFDLGGVLDERGHLSVIEDVRNKGLCTDAELGDVYHDLCGRGRRGSAAWQRLAELTERAGRPTMSDIELEFQQALIEAGLPPAIQQHPVTLPNGRTAYLDLAYPDCRLDIEIDHSEWHSTTTSVEQDKTRDLGLALLGWERLRFTERAIERRLRVCVATVRGVLELRHSGSETPAA